MNVINHIKNKNDDKHIIALKGEGDSGKTQTLLKLINMLYDRS
jgi:ABC-type proline/glycine betaine transport system ATPase subunit